jgi:heat-inducible transcriptional repressor
MRGEGEHERRRRAILTAIVREHVASGDPVGSKAIAKMLVEGLSPATIRNIMADLEAEGFLAQPHVSAGRVPTDKAYRFYVDQALGATRLDAATEKYIAEELGSSETRPEDLMAKTSRVLSEISHNVGLVLGPARDEKLLEHIKFVKLPDQRVLAVIVSKPDLIEHKVIRLEEEFSQDELDRTANFLNSEFRGWSLRTVRLEIYKRMEADKVLYDRLLRNVATLFMWGALAGEDTEGRLFVDGTAKLLDPARFEDVQKLRQFLSAFEEKAKLVKILNACLQSNSAGVQLLIGKENPDQRMHKFALVMAPLQYRERAVGALGVVGPTRMEYDRAITAVEYVAHLCSRLLSSN